MADQLTPVFGEWRIVEQNKNGEVLQDRQLTNLVVNSGKVMLLTALFMLTGSSGVVSMAVGASSTSPSVSNTTLVYELTGNGVRKPLTNTSGAALSLSDIVAETVVISGVTYTQKLVAQAQWLTGDANNGNTFAEYGLFDSANCPFTPTSSSGTMFNRLVDPSPTLKTAANIITSQVTIRF